MSDARAAGDLAAEIARREAVPDRAAVPDRNAYRSAGLLDDDLPLDAAVEVALALGRAGLQDALAVLSLDPVTAHQDLRLAAALAGAGDALVECGVGYAQQRVVFGRPLAKFPVQRNLFAAAAAGVDGAVALCRRAAAVGNPLDRASAVPVAADAAWVAAETALQVHGGYGYTDDYPVSRMWREVAAVRSQLPRPAYDDAVWAASATTSSAAVPLPLGEHGGR